MITVACQGYDSAAEAVTRRAGLSFLQQFV
nr:MAG TPA: hypothetical protein [Caudoviricetes sp.]